MRLGRALGYGARHAAKTVAAVAEAATAPDPRQAGVGAAGASRPSAVRPGLGERAAGAEGLGAAGAPPVGRRAQVKAERVRSAGRAAGRSVWGPLATFSSALWLRVTGSFFALVAWAMLAGAWRLRGMVHAGGDPQLSRHFWLFAGFGVLFGYFAVSSFVRASLRERRG